jgi:hypothetical protein
LAEASPQRVVAGAKSPRAFGRRVASHSHRVPDSVLRRDAVASVCRLSARDLKDPQRTLFYCTRWRVGPACLRLRQWTREITSAFALRP